MKRRCRGPAAQRVRDNLRVKEVRLDTDGRRFIVCHNPIEADRDRSRREETIARLQAELDRITTARAKTNKKKAGSRRDAENAAHNEGRVRAA